jgi:hypothetical protein
MQSLSRTTYLPTQPTNLPVLETFVRVPDFFFFFFWAVRISACTSVPNNSQ